MDQSEVSSLTHHRTDQPQIGDKQEIINQQRHETSNQSEPAPCSHCVSYIQEKNTFFNNYTVHTLKNNMTSSDKLLYPHFLFYLTALKQLLILNDNPVVRKVECGALQGTERYCRWSHQSKRVSIFFLYLSYCWDVMIINSLFVIFFQFFQY